MAKIIRTQINRDGSITIWNTMKDTKKHNVYYTIDKPEGLTQARLDRLNTLRDFNRLSEKEKFVIKFSSIVNHVPG